MHGSACTSPSRIKATHGWIREGFCPEDGEKRGGSELLISTVFASTWLNRLKVHLGTRKRHRLHRWIRGRILSWIGAAAESESIMMVIMPFSWTKLLITNMMKRQLQLAKILTMTKAMGKIYQHKISKDGFCVFDGKMTVLIGCLSNTCMNLIVWTQLNTQLWTNFVIGSPLNGGL